MKWVIIMYDVRIYKNTGLNAVNIVDKPSLLNDNSQFTYTSVPSLDILQNIFLSNIRIKSTWKNVKGVDYCRIGNADEGYFYYFVDGVTMQAGDVAELSLVPDYITSAGGIENVEILDGIITRCHVSDDTYGKWNIEDEFLTPSEPLLLDTHMIKFSNSSTTYIESSLDLGAMACVGASDAYIDSEGEAVQVPQTITPFYRTKFKMNGIEGSSTETSLTPVNNIIRAGVNRCRALGVESAVRSQVVMPNALVKATLGQEKANKSNMLGRDAVVLSVTGVDGLPDNLKTIYGKPLFDETEMSWNYVRTLSGSFVDNTTSLAYEYADVNNRRVLYGSLNKVGILTTAGNRLESNPEETRSGDAHITIRSVGDAHPTGAPYHRFKAMNGNSSTEGFFMNAVKGLQWKQIPLMYSEPSGNALNAINFQNSREMKDLQYTHTVVGAMEKGLSSLGQEDAGIAISALSGVVGAVAGALGGGMFGGTLGAVAGAIGGGVGGAMNTDKTIQSYHTARKQEMQQFAIQQHVSSPEISISYDGEAFRDFYGECVIVYRYRPTPADVKRLDNILTMYGYKVNVSGKDAPLNNRKYFNYLMGNITVGGKNLPKWLADGISLQVSNGVRIWHVKPSSNYYKNNPIKE